MTAFDRLPLPAEPQTPHDRLRRRTEAAVAERGEAAVAGLAVRLMTGAATPEDVTSGAARALTGDDGDLSPAATGALALMHAWHRSALPALTGALPALTGALTAPEADVRSAAHLVLASRAGSLRRDAAVDRALVDAVRAGCADPDPEVRASAASALGALARPEDLESALPVLTGMVMDVDADLAAAAELALEQLAIRLDRPGLRVSLEG